MGEVLPRKFGKYTLLRRLAQGGMAELYLALHRSMAGFEKLVVIKRILPEMAKDKAFITMLLQEARVAATLSHPNIVTTFDVGQAESTYFIAMEHIHGEDLRSIVRAMKPKQVTEFPVEHAISIVLGVAAGLAYAHERRDLNGEPLHLVHRDISPQNILVTFTGDAKLVDFGVAKAKSSAEVNVGEESSGTQKVEHHTRAGQLKGKIPYMSPEQARGENIDSRSDIFSLGIILFELCTGRRLFRGGNEGETLRMIVDGEYPRPSTLNAKISASLEAVIMKALAKNAEERYQTAREMQAELELLVRSEQLAVSTLSLANWMQFLFEEKLAHQKEALLQGKQLADVIAAESPEDYTSGGTFAGSLSLAPAQPPSKLPWVVASAGILLVAVLAGGLYAVKERQRAAQAAAERALHSGSITVRSTPPGAAIWVNGAATPHRTPFTLANLLTGRGARYRLRVTAEGYEPFAQEVVLAQQGARSTVDATLGLATAHSFAILNVVTDPPGATVLLDGRPVDGVTPLTAPGLEPGVEHTVVVHHPETNDEAFRFVGVAGQVERRTLTLQERPLGPGEAFLVVLPNPANAAVRVGDRSLVPPFRVRVDARQPVPVSVTAAGFEPYNRPARLRAGNTEQLRVELTHVRTGPAEQPVNRTPGSMRIGASPWCNITVDGSARGQTPVIIESIAPGAHTVVCNNPESGSQTQRVTVQPGAPLTVRFRF